MKMDYKALLLCLMLVVPFVFSQNPCDRPSRFTCNDGTCISIAKICNGRRNCPDGEDESSDRANCEGIRSCPTRDDMIVLSNGYKCRKSCDPNDPKLCKAPNMRCVCDDECGFSCINPDSVCDHEPPQVANSTGYRVMRTIGVRIRVLEEDHFQFGDMIRYTCPCHMRLTGPLPRCNSEKIWSEEIPQCVDAVCHDPPPHVNGAVSHRFSGHHDSCRSVSGQEVAIFNDVVFYECREGLARIGEPARCDANGQWTPQTQRCVVPCPRRSDPWEIKGLDLTCGPDCYTTEDCQPGMECYCDWTACGRACVNMSTDCGNATEVAFSTLNYTGEGIQRVARYKCDEGYYLASGRPSLRCTGSGQWVGDIPKCEVVYCSSPVHSIEATGGNMTMIYRSDTRYGATVEFSCPSNYRLLGTRFRTCLGNVQWSGELTACDLIDNEERCPHPGVPINGQWTWLQGRDFSVGASVRFSCDPGYILSGEAEQTCLRSLQWSADRAPKCINPKFSHLQSDTRRSHEIYFMIDISESVLMRPDDLKDEIEFSKRLVRRMEGFKGNVNYAIILIHSRNVTVMDIVTNGYIPTAKEVIKTLDDVYNKALLVEYQRRRPTGHAWRELRKMLTIMSEKEPENMRQVFIFTDGQHTEGDYPVQLRRMIEREFWRTIEFYSITACERCNSEALEELQGLSSKHGKNYIFIEDFYLLSDYLDQVTDLKLDFEKCGQAGDVGSIRHQPSLARVVGGDDGTDTAWPWQALVTRRASGVKEVFHERQMLGGGSLLNNHWVLTVAHLFTYLEGDESWAQDIIVSLGIFERPVYGKLLEPVRMFIPEKIIIHENFLASNYMEHNIALIKLGKELDIIDSQYLDEIEADGVEYSYYIRPVCLPCMGNCLRDDQMVDDNGESLLWDGITEEEKCQVEENLLQSSKAKIVVTGFGDVSISRPGEQIRFDRVRLARRLQQGLLQIVDRPTCELELAHINAHLPEDHQMVFTENSICCKSGKEGAEEVDTCNGDGGGPVVREVIDAATNESCWVQIGIVNWGYGCGTGIPSFHTNVARYIPWIKQHILQQG